MGVLLNHKSILSKKKKKKKKKKKNSPFDSYGLLWYLKIEIEAKYLNKNNCPKSAFSSGWIH